MRRWLLLLVAGPLAGCRGETGVSGHGRTYRPPAAVAVKPFALGRPDAVLLITGGTNGMMEVCNCRGPMPGGLARRSGLVRSYRAAFPHALLIDTGDCFWVEPEDVRNEYVLKGYRRIGYDAVVLGDQEWAVAAADLPRLLAGGPETYLSTNVSPAGAAGPALVREAVTRQWPGAKLAVLSDVRGAAFWFFSKARLAELTVLPAEEVVRRVRQLKRDGFVVVLAAHTDEEGVEQIARTCPADLILRGHTSRTEPGVLSAAGRPVVKVGGAETVGVVAMKIAGGKIDRMEYRAELVDERWPIDHRLLQTYQAYAHAAMRQALDAKRSEGLDYVPSSQCGQCHQAQYRAWEQGPHAGAYRTLAKAGRTFDPNCLMCHTTGFGTVKGFYTIEKTPQLAGVNCQNCHRFNEPEHRQGAGVKAFRFPRIDENLCTTCHTPVTDPNFRYKAKLPKVRCPRSPKSQAATGPAQVAPRS